MGVSDYSNVSRPPLHDDVVDLGPVFIARVRVDATFAGGPTGTILSSPSPAHGAQLVDGQHSVQHAENRWSVEPQYWSPGMTVVFYQSRYWLADLTVKRVSHDPTFGTITTYYGVNGVDWIFTKGLQYKFRVIGPVGE